MSMEYCNYQSAGVADLPVFDPEDHVDVFWTAMVPIPLQTGQTPVDDSPQQCLL